MFERKKYFYIKSNHQQYAKEFLASVFYAEEKVRNYLQPTDDQDFCTLLQPQQIDTQF